MKDNYIILFLGVITLVLLGCVLKAAQVVILPLIIAWLLSYLFYPVVNFLARYKVPSSISVVVILFLLLGFFYLIGIFIQARVMIFIDQYDVYAEKLQTIIVDVSTKYNFSQDLFREFDWSERIENSLLILSGSFVNLARTTLMILIFLVFMLLGEPFRQRKIDAAFAKYPTRAHQIASVTNAITGQISRYLLVKLLISAITGFLVWVALVSLHVDFPVTWAVLTFLLNFIPTVGSIIATIPPVLLALIQFYPNFWPSVIVLTLLFIIQQVMGNFIDPKMMGDRLNLSPVVILLSLIFWGWLWGITGALLSVPIASAIKIVCENIELLKPISVLMGSGKAIPDDEEAAENLT